MQVQILPRSPKSNNMKNTIKSIGARNLKGQSFHHDLAPVTMFVGDNFKGKTSRIDAVFLALLGWLPGVAKKPSDIYTDLASGPEMGVSATLRDRVVERSWRESKGSVKYVGSGDDIEFPPVALVTSEFLSLSAPERVKFLFARATLPPEYSVQTLLKAITINIKNTRLDVNSEHSEQVISQLVLGLPELLNGEPSPQEFVSSVAAFVGDRKKLAAQSVQRMEKTQQGLVVIAPDAQAASDAEVRLTDARASLTQASSKLAVLEAEGRRLGSEVGRLTALAKSAVVDEAKARAELDSLSKRKEKIGKRCLTVPDGSALHKARTQIASELAEASAAAGAAFRAFKEAEANRNTLKADKNPCCRTCGQSLKKLIATVIEAAEKEVVRTWELRCKTLKAEEALVEKQNEVDAKLKDFEKQLEDYKKDQQEFRSVSAQHANLQKQLEDNSKAAEAKAQLPALERQLEQMRSDYKQAQAVEQEARRLADEYEVAYKDLVAQRSRFQQQELARQELERCRIEVEVLKCAASMLADLQAQLLELAVEPLIAKANELCSAILKHPLAYKDGDIGFGFGGCFYSHRSFSGTEKALAYAALSVALAQDAPIRLVILDELGRLDKDRKFMLLEHLCKLSEAGAIDQALLVDVDSPAFGMKHKETFKLIEL